MAKDSGGLSDAEKAAVRERSRELRAQKKGKKGEDALLAAIAEMAESDRVIAEKIHEIVQTVAPDLEPKTHYGMPAYARDGKVVLFFQAASKYDTRYPTLGFDEKANLDRSEERRVGKSVDIGGRRIIKKKIRAGSTRWIKA